MVRSNAIGEYLRARRQLVQPEDVGLPNAGMRRRTPGLRREEVAMLAGVSADYYIRLEQGRDHHPSAQVLGALALALQLDEDATAYLHTLASPAPPRRRRGPSRPERVPAGILQLLGTWTDTPAYVYGRYMDVLAANPLARALSPFNEPGINLVRAVFLDSRLYDVLEDWDAAAKSTVAGLRALVGPDSDDPRLNELVGELSVCSEPFRQLWARHDVRPKRSGVTHREHPQVGPIDLNYEKLPIPDADRMTLCICHAAPGSPSAQALALLATIVVSTPTRTASNATSCSALSFATGDGDEPWQNVMLHKGSRPAVEVGVGCAAFQAEGAVIASALCTGELRRQP